MKVKRTDKFPGWPWTVVGSDGSHIAHFTTKDRAQDHLNFLRDRHDEKEEG